MENLEQIFREHSGFVNNLKIGDKVIVDLGNKPEDELYREATIDSEVYIAPSENRYINVSINNEKYAVPTWDIYPLGSKEIIYKAYIYYKGHRGSNFSGRGTYILWFEGNIIDESIGSCTGRKDANKKLIDEKLLKKYGINRVYSNDILIWSL